MNLFRVAVYSLTITGTLLLSFWETKLKHRLTEDTPQPPENVSDYGMLSEISKNIRRERFLNTLPPNTLTKLRTVIGLKFLGVALLVLEVIVFQR
jgi:hypothetical protein